MKSMQARDPRKREMEPHIVTLSGSPPKAEMNLLTQRSAVRSDSKIDEDLVSNRDSKVKTCPTYDHEDPDYLDLLL